MNQEKLEIEVDPDLSWAENMSNVLQHKDFDDCCCENEILQMYLDELRTFISFSVANLTLDLTELANLRETARNLYEDHCKPGNEIQAALMGLCFTVCLSLSRETVEVKQKCEQILNLLNVNLREKIKIMLIN